MNSAAISNVIESPFTICITVLYNALDERFMYFIPPVMSKYAGITRTVRNAPEVA